MSTNKMILQAKELPVIAKSGGIWDLFSLILQELLVFFDKNFVDDQGKVSIPKVFNPIFIYRAVILVKKIMELIAEYRKENHKSETEQTTI